MSIGLVHFFDTIQITNIQACVQCFMKLNCFMRSNFVEKCKNGGQLHNVIFLNWGHLDQIEIHK